MAINTKSALNINNFISRIGDRGISKANRIAVQIKPPFEVVGILDYINKDEYLTYYAESVAMPGVEFSTAAIYFGGPPMTFPTRSEYRDISISFLVDDYMRQKTFFDSWMNYINPKENKFDFRYRDDIIGEIDIFQITEDGKYISYALRMYEVFPISMAEIKGSWAEQEPVRIDISFSYRYWRSLNADAYERNDPDGPGYSFIDYKRPSRQETVGDIDVIGQPIRRGRETLADVDVIGQNRDRETLADIDVIGTPR